MLEIFSEKKRGLLFKVGISAQNVVFGTDRMVAAGIDYIADLAEANPNGKFIISVSLGGNYPDKLTEDKSADNSSSEAKSVLMPTNTLRVRRF